MYLSLGNKKKKGFQEQHQSITGLPVLALDLAAATKCIMLGKTPCFCLVALRLINCLCFGDVTP